MINLTELKLKISLEDNSLFIKMRLSIKII